MYIVIDIAPELAAFISVSAIAAVALIAFTAYKIGTRQ